MLADFGARVIKIENPKGGDFARDYDDVVLGQAAHFVWANRGKESVTLNLEVPEGMECCTGCWMVPTPSCPISRPVPPRA